MKALAAIVAILLVAAYLSRTWGIAEGSRWRSQDGKIVTVSQVRAGFVYFSDTGYIDGTMFKILYARIDQH